MMNNILIIILIILIIIYIIIKNNVIEKFENLWINMPTRHPKLLYDIRGIPNLTLFKSGDYMYYGLLYGPEFYDIQGIFHQPKK